MDSSLGEKYIPILRQYWLPLALGLLGLMFLVYGMIGFFGKKDDTSDILFEASTQPATVSAKQKTLVVDVEGAVFKPGVYKLPEDARVQDALIAAGGMSNEADRDLISKQLNLASKVVDGGKIYVPFSGEQVFVGQAGQEVAGVESMGLIDINSASESQLDALSGIGPITSKKIIDNRPYQSIEELVAKKVVGAKLFGQIKDKITAQ